MFRKSLALLCMVFGLNALAEAPQHITVQQLIGMIDNHNHILSENNQETWAIDPNGYNNGQQAFRGFLGRLPLQHHSSRMNERPRARAVGDKVIYNLIGENIQDRPQTCTLMRIA
jgi:hypothetical protein